MKLSKSDKYIFFSYGFSFLFAINYVVQQSPLGSVLFHVESLLFIGCIGYFLIRDKNLALYFCVFYFICFHQYGADPYSERLINFLSGPYKLIVLVLFMIGTFDGVINKKGLFILVLCIFPSVFQLTYSEYFRVKYFYNDVIYYLALLPLILFGRRKNITFNISQCVYHFSLTMPLLCLFSYVTGLGVELKGSYYFYYGHLFSFLLLYSFLYRFFSKSCTSQLSAFIVLLNFIIFFQSAQSAHFIILLMVLIVSTLLTRRFKMLFVCMSFVALFIVIAANVPKGSWLALKTGQVIKIAALTQGGGNISAINSLAIRYYSLIAIIDGNTPFENLFGRGISTIYRDTSGNFSTLNMHNATFPVEEISSGEFHLIHETLIRLFMHFGISGIVFFTLYLYSLIKIDKYNTWYLCTLIFFAFLWMSSVQFMGLICMFLTLVLREGSTGELKRYKEN